MNPTKRNTATTAGLQHENSGKKVIGKPFAPGVSGNPSGRRRGSVSLTATLKKRLTKADARAIADKLIQQAKTGNRNVVRVILERCGDELPLPLLCGMVQPVAPIVNFIIPDNRRSKGGGTE